VSSQPAASGAGGPDLAQQWADDRGAGHREHRAEQDRCAPRQAGEQMGGERREDPGDERAHAHQAADDAAVVGDFGPLQREAAFEQQQRHRQRDDG